VNATGSWLTLWGPPSCRCSSASSPSLSANGCRYTRLPMSVARWRAGSSPFLLGLPAPAERPVARVMAGGSPRVARTPTSPRRRRVRQSEMHSSRPSNPSAPGQAWPGRRTLTWGQSSHRLLFTSPQCTPALGRMDGTHDGHPSHRVVSVLRLQPIKVAVVSPLHPARRHGRPRLGGVEGVAEAPAPKARIVALITRPTRPLAPCGVLPIAAVQIAPVSTEDADRLVPLERNPPVRLVVCHRPNLSLVNYHRMSQIDHGGRRVDFG